MEENFKGDIDIEVDMAHQRRTWRIKRIAWVVMMILLVAVLIGFTGGGPVSKKMASTGSTNIEYESITRYKRPTLLKVHFNPVVISEDSIVKITMDRAFIDKMEVDRIAPEPESSELGTDAVVFNFKAGNFTNENFVTFYFNPDYFGCLDMRVQVGNEPSYNLSQFIYP